MRSRLWLVIVLLAVFVFVPSGKAIADDGVTKEEEKLELEYRVINDSKAPATPFSMISNVFYNTTFQFDGRTVRLAGINHIYFFRQLLIYFMPTFVALVFLWWGVRKVIRMLFRAFRKGKANV